MASKSPCRNYGEKHLGWSLLKAPRGKGKIRVQKGGKPWRGCLKSVSRGGGKKGAGKNLSHNHKKEGNIGNPPKQPANTGGIRGK